MLSVCDCILEVYQVCRTLEVLYFYRLKGKLLIFVATHTPVQQYEFFIKMPPKVPGMRYDMIRVWNFKVTSYCGRLRVHAVRPNKISPPHSSCLQQRCGYSTWYLVQYMLLHHTHTHTIRTHLELIDVQIGVRFHLPRRRVGVERRTPPRQGRDAPTRGAHGVKGPEGNQSGQGGRDKSRSSSYQRSHASRYHR